MALGCWNGEQERQKLQAAISEIEASSAAVGGGGGDGGDGGEAMSAQEELTRLEYRVGLRENEYSDMQADDVML